tara:strand:- start:1835 stop:2359 length:525 start_codon:yes stop_codon:yes gene_type:complete
VTLDPLALARILKAGVRPVPDWPGYYATTAGEILSTRQPRHVAILRMFPHKRTGHLKVKLYRAGVPRGANRYVHRLVCLAWHGAPPMAIGLDGEPIELSRVLHGNDIETDNRPSNLRWGDQVENMGDRRWNATAPPSAEAAGLLAGVEYYARHERAQALAGALGVYLPDPRWGF